MKRRYNGPTCGRRYLVNVLFDVADRFYRSLLHLDATWIGDPKWHGRYRALRRSWRNHGIRCSTLDALSYVTLEWKETQT